MKLLRYLTLLLCCILFTAVTVPSAGAADTNSPPAGDTASATKTPTYEEIIRWLESKYLVAECIWSKYIEGINKIQRYYSHTISVTTNGQVSIGFKKTEKYFFSESGIVNFDYRVVFMLNEIKDAFTDEGYEGEYFVKIRTVGGKKVIKEEDVISQNCWTLDKTLIFHTNDKDLAERVAKAFNRLIELAPKDDLFK